MIFKWKIELYIIKLSLKVGNKNLFLDKKYNQKSFRKKYYMKLLILIIKQILFWKELKIISSKLMIKLKFKIKLKLKRKKQFKNILKIKRK